MYKTINLLQEVLVYGMVFSCRKWNFVAPVSQLHAESMAGDALLSSSLFLHLRPLRAELFAISSPQWGLSYVGGWWWQRDSVEREKEFLSWGNLKSD